MKTKKIVSLMISLGALYLFIAFAFYDIAWVTTLGTWEIKERLFLAMMIIIVAGFSVFQ